MSYGVEINTFFSTCVAAIYCCSESHFYNNIIEGFTEIRKIPSMEKFRGANDKSVTQ